MFDDLFDRPAAAEIMADDAVKSVGAVSAFWRSFSYDPFDIIDAVLRRRAGVECPGLSLLSLCWRCCAQITARSSQGVDVAERLAVAELQAGNGERLAGAPE